MKWNNKGKEFDVLGERLLHGKNGKVFLFGYGMIADQKINTLNANGLLAGIIDNDENKQGQIVCEKEIISFQEFLLSPNAKEYYIVITASIKNKQVIGMQLKEKGLIHGKDYFYHDEFFDRILPIIMVYKKDKSYVSLAQISLTERCTLKCKKCAHACYAVSNEAEDLSLEKVYKSADVFFEKVDYIQEFVLIGGEPLLYKHLANAIEYIGENYRNQMNIFCITTNGTITPKDEVLELCKKYNVLFRISDYSIAVPRLDANYARLIKRLQDYDISYIRREPEKEWIDYGFEYVNRECSEEELIKVFSSCNTPCREVRGNKYYYCVMARTVSDNLDLGVGQEDYLDLENLTSKTYKKELLEFNLGYSEKGYLDMCRHCHGKDAKNYPIPAAEQA